MGKFVFHRGSASDFAMIAQGALLAITYLGFAAVAVWEPTGIVAVRVAQGSWFLVGFFGTNVLFSEMESDGRHGFFSSRIWVIGISIGALTSTVLTWGLGRSGERYDASEMLLPAIAAAVCSAIAVALPPGRRSLEVRGDGWKNLDSRERMLLCISGFTACSLAIACTVTCMMMWETFSFPPAWVALMVANVGLLTLAIQFIASRVLERDMGSLSIILVSGVGLVFMGGSAGTLMWGPNTDSGMIVFAGNVMLCIGWGLWTPGWMKLAPKTNFALDDWVWTVAWIVGPICSAGLFYDHERTSFGSGGVAVALAILTFLLLLRASTRQAVAGSATSEAIRGGLA
jgi:hypothetical protein